MVSSETNVNPINGFYQMYMYIQICLLGVIFGQFLMSTELPPRTSIVDDVGGERRTLPTSETRINFAPQSGYAAARFSHEYDPEAGLGSTTLSGR